MARKSNSNEAVDLGCGLGCIAMIVLVAIAFVLASIGPTNFLIGIGVVVAVGILALIAWGYQLQQNENEIKKRRLARDDQIQRELSELADRELQLLASPAHTYLREFVRKYGVGAPIGVAQVYLSERNNLSELLERNGWEFSQDQLTTLMRNEKARQDTDHLSSRILAAQPKFIAEYVTAYLNATGGADLASLPILEQLLTSRGLGAENLEDLVNAMKHELEINEFEARLVSGESRVRLLDVDQMGGYEFEELLKRLYSRMGYEVEQTRLSGDKGADLVLNKLGERTVVQAKCYSASVGNKAVQEILAAMSLYAAHKGVVVTNNYYTKAAKELARANNIELIDREHLQQMLLIYM